MGKLKGNLLFKNLGYNLWGYFYCRKRKLQVEEKSTADPWGCGKGLV